MCVCVCVTERESSERWIVARIFMKGKKSEDERELYLKARERGEVEKSNLYSTLRLSYIQ